MRVQQIRFDVAGQALIFARTQRHIVTNRALNVSAENLVAQGQQIVHVIGTSDRRVEFQQIEDLLALKVTITSGVLRIEGDFNVINEWIDHGEKCLLLTLVFLDQFMEQIQCLGDETVQIGLFRLFDRLSHSGMATLRFTGNQMVFTSFIIHRSELLLLVYIRLLRPGFLSLRHQMEDKAKERSHREIRIVDQTGLKALQTRFTLGDLSRVVVR